MDWLNLHVSVLDSPQVLRCDPIRRATWLFLLRYCISQENGGLIEDCTAWGDTSWQQIVRVKLREVLAESPLWTWEGNNLRVTFYPAEKEAEVQAKRTGGTYGGKSSTEAKAQAARENGRRGGRPKTQAETQAPETKEPKLNPTEWNGREWKGKEVSAAAPPHAQETDAAAADPMSESFESVEKANPAPRRALPPLSFADWRIQVGKRIFWTRDEDDTWRAMFEAEGWGEMTRGYEHLAARHPAPKKLFLSMFQELRA
jgi:hypothetical protein